MLTTALIRPPTSTQGVSTVLVHAGSSRNAEALMRAAVSLANQFKARLVGVSTPPAITTDAHHTATLPEAEAAQLVVDAAGARFEEMGRDVRAGACWRLAEGPPAAALARFAWAADLIMTNVHVPTGAGEPGESLRELVVGGRRPVLVRPPVGATTAEFRRIAVLWDPSPACARAITAALPFMARADRITLLVESHHAGRADDALEDLRLGLGLRGLKIDVAEVEHGVGRDRSHRHAVEALQADLLVLAAWRRPMPWLPLADDTDAVIAGLKTFALLSH